MDLSLFTSFAGRISRKSFWLGLAALCFALIVSAALAGLMLGAVMSAVGDGQRGPEFHLAMSAVATLLTVVFAYSLLALGIKRLHDRDRAGRGHIKFLLPLIGPLWLFVEVAFRKGVIGPNQHGADPLIF